MDTQTIKSTECCEQFNPEPWDGKEITWNNKIFVKDHVTSFLHIPLNFGQKVVKNMKLIEAAGAKSPQQLMLTDEKSLWGADIYIDVSKNVAGAEMAILSGTFLTKVFEGPFQNAGKWAQEMQKYVSEKTKNNPPSQNASARQRKLYFCYTTCPKCAKAYGKNYVVLFAKIS
jgi:hypothetical protein